MSLQNFLEIVPVIFAAGESKLFHLSGAYFEIIDAPNPVDVVLTDRNGVPRGVMKNAEASFFIKSTDYDTIQLTSATAQTIRFAFGTSEAGTRRSTGSVTISGSVALDAPSLAALESVDLNPATLSTLNTYRNPITPNGFWNDDGNVVANSSKTIFTAAANVNGAIILRADIASYFSGSRREAFIKKNGGLPVSITDGAIVCLGRVIAVPSDVMIAGELQYPQFIEPGFSLSYISTGGITANSYSQRSCIYRLL
jgi:hypothetical protein